MIRKLFITIPWHTRVLIKDECLLTSDGNDYQPHLERHVNNRIQCDILEGDSFLHGNFLHILVIWQFIVGGNEDWKQNRVPLH